MLISLFQFQFLTAQESSGGENIDTTYVYVDQSTNIFSKDESFNKFVRFKEISTSKIVCEKSQASVSNSVTTETNKKEAASHKLSEELKLTQEKEQQIILEEVKKEIEKFESKNKSAVGKEFFPPPSSSTFSGSKANIKDYISPKPCNQDVCKQMFFTEPFLVKKALGYLHTLKFFYYNNKSLDDCLTLIFSVRPPPQS